MKSYTDLNQSKKLAKILPLESADMSWILVNYGDEAGSRHEPSLATYKTGSFFRDRIFPKDHTIPCWSLAALLKIIKYYDIEADDSIIIKRNLCYDPYQITTQKHNDIINACYEMILKLHEQNLL